MKMLRLVFANIPEEYSGASHLGLLAVRLAEIKDVILLLVAADVVVIELPKAEVLPVGSESFVEALVPPRLIVTMDVSPSESEPMFDIPEALMGVVMMLVIGFVEWSELKFDTIEVHPLDGSVRRSPLVWFDLATADPAHLELMRELMRGMVERWIDHVVYLIASGH